MNDEELIKYLKDQNSRMAFLIGQFYSYVNEMNYELEDKGKLDMATRVKFRKAQERLFMELRDTFYGEKKNNV